MIQWARLYVVWAFTRELAKGHCDLKQEENADI